LPPGDRRPPRRTPATGARVSRRTPPSTASGSRACGRACPPDRPPQALPTPGPGNPGRPPRTRSAYGDATGSKETTSVGGSAGSVGTRAAGGARTLERVLQDVPREHGALDPDRVLHDTLQGHEVAERRFVGLGLAGHHLAELGRQPEGLADRLALNGFGHHRGRGLGDGAPGALERDALHATSVHVREDRDLVSAHRVVRGAPKLRTRQLVLVPRILVVVEDDFLVDVVERHGPSVSA